MEAKLASMSKRANRTPTPEPGREADALEAEIMQELERAGSGSKVAAESKATTPVEPTSEPPTAPTELTEPTEPAEPAEPAQTETPPAKPDNMPRPRADDERTRARRAEFERGLASLPSKPTFS
jgi:hypothetical protein